MLTFCRRYPDLLGSKVKGLILVDTTFTVPLRTGIGAHILRRLQSGGQGHPSSQSAAMAGRVVDELAKLPRRHQPLVTRLMSFSRDVTRGELEFAARFTATEHPAVVAKDILAILDWDESATLEWISVPTAVIVGKEVG